MAPTRFRLFRSRLLKRLVCRRSGRRRCRAGSARRPACRGGRPSPPAASPCRSSAGGCTPTGAAPSSPARPRSDRHPARRGRRPARSARGRRDDEGARPSVPTDGSPRLGRLAASSSADASGRMVSFTSAPASRSARTASRWPARTAKRSADQPAVDRSSTSAPSSRRACTAAGWFSAAAHMRAVWPRQRSRARRSAPRASSIRMMRTSPVRAAVINAVSPSGRASFASPPASSRASTTGALPARTRAGAA